MTGPSEIPVVHANLPCRDEREFQRRLAPHMGKEGIFVPSDPPLEKGSRVLLRLHWIGGAVGVRGEAVVTEVSTTGSTPGMTVKLVRLDEGSAKFPLTDEPVAQFDDNRFGPWPDDPTGQIEIPVTPPSPPKPPARIWQLPTTPATRFDDFDLPETGPGLLTAVGSYAPEQRTRVQAPAAELLRAAGGAEVELPLGPSARFGAYWLLIPLGEGGELEAWIAASTTSSSLCIVKAAREPGEVSTALLARARAVAPLVHPNLAKVVDFGDVAGRSYVAFEHLHGRKLDAIFLRLRAVQVVPQVELAVAIGLHLCRALEYLHTSVVDSSGRPCPIAHGKVHAGNVFIGAEGEIRLEGLGLSELGPHRTPTPADDLHALGGLLHVLMTLREPPPAASPPELLDEPRHHWHRRPSEWNRAIPESIDGIVLGATHADPSKRYPSIREFRSALEDEHSHHSTWSLAAAMQEMFGPELDRERTDLTELAQRARQGPA